MMQDKIKKALEFYAKTGNWVETVRHSEDGDETFSKASRDGGEIARDALSQPDASINNGVREKARIALKLIENELLEAHADSDMTDNYVSKIEAAFKTIRLALLAGGEQS